jgi:hypothetical protein
MIELAIGFVLEKVGTLILDNLAGKIGEDIWEKLKRDPQKAALKRALGAAIKKYGTSSGDKASLRLVLCTPLLEKNGFLTNPAVVEELTQLIHRDREPDAQLIGEKWMEAMDDPPSWCNFTLEAKRFLKDLESELKCIEVLRPIFDSQSLDRIATYTESLPQIEAYLAKLIDFNQTRYGILTRTFLDAPDNLRDCIRDYTSYIQEKTHGFVGREQIMKSIESFLQTHSRGYFFVRGDPGIGKSALSAQLVRMHGYVHHFNILSMNIYKPEAFLKNICAQLIITYNLKHNSLPPETIQDGGFFYQLLGEAADQCQPDTKVVIVLDALDEADAQRMPPGVNTLYLPPTLPQNVLIIITTRRMSIDNQLRIDCEQEVVDIEPNDPANISDIEKYLAQEARRPGIQAYIAEQKANAASFIKQLRKKSEGNFIYLTYMLVDLERGIYKDTAMAALPSGLQNYYNDHWRRMRGKDENIWFTYKLPVILVLSLVEEPVSIELIAKFLEIEERTHIRDVIKEWDQFLHKVPIIYNHDVQDRYYLYHTSFHDFLAQKEEIQEEKVDRREIYNKIVKYFSSQLFD